MHDDDFRSLKVELLRAGIAPGHVRRTVVELKEHVADIIESEMAAGSDLATARRRASREIGDPVDIVRGMRAYPELLCWERRFPRLAVVIYPLTCLALLPAVPVFIGVAYAPQVARWSMSLLFGALVTASMLLLMQLSILLA
jgi:hypothetical protein